MVERPIRADEICMGAEEGRVRAWPTFVDDAANHELVVSAHQDGASAYAAGRAEGFEPRRELCEAQFAIPASSAARTNAAPLARVR
jgi:hypothetical protein